MAHVSLRVTDQEKLWMESYAKLNGVNLSEAVKDAFFEKLEGEFDLKVVAEYEDEPNKMAHPHDEVKKMLGID
ncbi:DUF6290 family protein [Eubacteriaceae bacterium ES2]|nr:DUF6290 family protein [Eubacteriaceae bacterium ES2]